MILEAQQPGGTQGILQSTETPCERQMDLPFQALRTRDSTKLRACWSLLPCGATGVTHTRGQNYTSGT